MLKVRFFDIGSLGRHEVTVPVGSVPLTVENRLGSPRAWVEVETEEIETMTLVFMTVDTGVPFDDEGFLYYLASYPVADGHAYHHVYAGTLS